MGVFNSVVACDLLNVMAPTLDFSAGAMANMPVPADFIRDQKMELARLSRECCSIAKDDWNSLETSWGFSALPFVQLDGATSVAGAFGAWDKVCVAKRHALKAAEERLNQVLIDAYGLASELEPEIREEQIILTRPDRHEDTKRHLSYAIGCMMGRYSLDKPGLIYAHAGNVGFDPNQYKTFPADDDGIIPLLETDWGIRDDAVNRIVEFISVAWPKEHLEENLKFIADSLGPARNERPRDTIRRYLATGFYKDHLRWYKRRPIYWLFSSGKERAFQCLVYLHRYHEGTLARMRTEYVIPLQGKIAARIEQLEGDKAKATSTSHRRNLQKEQDKLKRQQAELLTFDEKLKHHADQRITLDLDDGVKVNYGKFGDLLSDVKAVCGTKEED
jgi:hypothetical protein